MPKQQNYTHPSNVIKTTTKQEKKQYTCLAEVLCKSLFFNQIVLFTWYQHRRP